MVAIDPPYEEEILATPLDVDSSHTGRAVIEKRGLIINNPIAGDEGTQIPGTPVEEEERLVIVPLFSDDEVIGAMTLNRMGVNFGKEDLALAETYASYASTAINNAHAHSDLQREVEERKRAEEELENIVKLAREYKAQHVLHKHLELKGDQKKIFMKTLEKYFPHLVEKYKKLYGDSYKPDNHYLSKINNIMNKWCTRHLEE